MRDVGAINLVNIFIIQQFAADWTGFRNLHLNVFNLTLFYVTAFRWISLELSACG